MKPTICAILCAGGKGRRAGFETNKLFAPLQGKTVLEKTLCAFDLPYIDEIVVATAKVDLEETNALISAFPRTKTVLGGETRSHSVYNALQATQADIVLIHDGARPFVSEESIQSCIQSVRAYGSGICAIDCTDTIAVSDGAYITSVPNRANLKQIQTPQGFFREKILYAYKRAMENGDVCTDDSSVFALYCEKPRFCAGARDNIKLTYAQDFPRSVRCGFGVDTHAFGKIQNYVLLGGVKIPSESGLIAHSDGDVLVHALMDALLSAVGLKDIGFYFPDSDEKWKNADSMQMLARVLQMLAEKGYGVENVSIAVQAEKPRLAKYIDEIKVSLANALQIPPTAVGVTAGTNEGLGYVGEGKGITVYAYVLVKG